MCNTTAAARAGKTGSVAFSCKRACALALCCRPSVMVLCYYVIRTCVMQQLTSHPPALPADLGALERQPPHGRHTNGAVHALVLAHGHACSKQAAHGHAWLPAPAAEWRCSFGSSRPAPTLGSKYAADMLQATPAQRRGATRSHRALQVLNKLLLSLSTSTSAFKTIQNNPKHIATPCRSSTTRTGGDSGDTSAAQPASITSCTARGLEPAPGASPASSGMCVCTRVLGMRSVLLPFMCCICGGKQ